MRCIECGRFCRKIGNVPPETFECPGCGEVFRATEENLIKAPVKIDREKVQASRDNYPSYIRPSYRKLRGED